MDAPERPAITWPGLFALLRDDLARDRGAPFGEWVKRENFEPETIVALTNFLTATWKSSGERIEALVLMAFTFGWDAHRDLRGERST